MKAILSFILLSGLLCWLIFSGVFYHVLLMRQTYLQQEVDYLLEIATQSRYGYLADSEIAQSKNRLALKGLDRSKIEYAVSSTTGQSATDELNPIQRGDGIILTIRYPYDGLLNINKLIGMDVPSEHARLIGYGQRMSEFVWVQGD